MLSHRLGLVLLGLALAAGLARAADAPAAILKTSRPVLIDGVLDEPCWKAAAPVGADYINSKQGVLSDKPHLAIRFAYDDYFLYIGYETFDSNLVALGTRRTQGPRNNQREGAVIWMDGVKVDVVEFFVSFGDEHFFWEIHHNAANQFNDVWCMVVDPSWPVAQSSMAPYGIIFGDGMFIEDDAEGKPSGDHKLAMAVTLKPKADGKPSTIDDPSDTDAGYVGELRLPWAGLGAPMKCRTWLDGEPAAPGKPRQKLPGPWNMTDQEVWILAAVQDGDLAERYHHSSPTRKGDWFHKTAALWPRYTLAPEPPKQ